MDVDNVTNKCVVSIPNYYPSGNYSIYGSHKNCSGAIGDDVGKDWWMFALKNGWKLHTVQAIPLYTKTNSASYMPSTETLAGSIGKAFWDVQATWKVPPSEKFSYSYKFHIIGPKGVPHF